MGNTVSPCTPLEKMNYEPCVKAMGESECEVNHVLNTDKMLVNWCSSHHIGLYHMR